MTAAKQMGLTTSKAGTGDVSKLFVKVRACEPLPARRLASWCGVDGSELWCMGWMCETSTGDGRLAGGTFQGRIFR